MKIAFLSSIRTAIEESARSSIDWMVWVAPFLSDEGGGTSIDFWMLKEAVIMKKISSRNVMSTIGVRSISS
jgi:hypothetical protein